LARQTAILPGCDPHGYMETLKLTSCLAANTDPACAAVADYIGRRLRIRAQFVDNVSWQERERLLDSGEIHIGWICGLLYTWMVSQPQCPLKLLAAPLVSGTRYLGKPVYYSDVIVHRRSPVHTFDQLRGASLAFNESQSYSGFHVLRWHLSTLGECDGYFGSLVESGAHGASLQLVRSRQVEASAIDSTLLDWELRRDPSLQSDIRVVETIGPSPVPPWVISKKLPQDLQAELNRLLLHMHEDPAGRRSLALGRLSGFAHTEDRDYDPIRDRVEQAAQVRL
jgi:phosphonate transport system substrate-binding protein